MRYLSIFGVLAAFILVTSTNPDGSRFVGWQTPQTNDLGWGVCGAAIVFIFYWIKFNEWAGEGQAPVGFRPRPVRHFTTWIRYLGWNSLYGVIMAAAYCAILVFPDFLSNFIEVFKPVFQALGLGEIIEPLSAVVGNQEGVKSAVPYAVIVTTAVWAGMPPLSGFEEKFRLRWQKNAAIPSQAVEMLENFKKDTTGKKHFSPNTDTVKEIVRDLGNNTLEAENFLQPGSNIWFLYARSTYLYTMLERHSSTEIKKMAERQGSEFSELEAQMQKLHKLVEKRLDDTLDLCGKERINTLRQLIEPGNSEQDYNRRSPSLQNNEQWLEKYLPQESQRERKYFNDQKDNLVKAINSITNEIMQLLVCGVLAVGRSLKRRKTLLSRFGLKDLEKTSIQLDYSTLILIAISGIGITFLCSTIYLFVQNHLHHLDGGYIPSDMQEVVRWSVFAGLMHLMAICSGYLVQQDLEEERKDEREGENSAEPEKLAIGVQIAEGVWSALLGISINVFLLGFFTAIQGDFSALGKHWWWAIVPGVTAFFAALYTQNVDRSLGEFNRLLLWQGLATGVMAFFVFITIYYRELLPGESFSATPNFKSLTVFCVYCITSSTILGIALGKCLNLWVTAEKFSGEANRRRDKRKKFLFKKGFWQTDDGEISVQAVSVSGSGAELKTQKPLPVNSKGVLNLPGIGTKTAIVKRIDKKDQNRSFVQFPPDPAGDFGSATVA